ncbi:phospholipid scramblase-related protein [Streptomyces sp. CB02959]|uniref:phospholipid scramblase-related protein n=1 Tax=Streptomyces sp. CB02959 TaxID=2020330 RepID=UPI000C27849D|nr:phospholipid scramblase-related protein [Streptomyces sp. CB02959]PJN42077.1 Scramblase [Streptomyces sp. CB02959]
MTQTNIPAGWYTDPQGTPQQLRWWDGSQWTGHTHPGQQAQPPAQAGQPGQPQPAPQHAPQQAPQAQMPQQYAPQQQPAQAPYGQQGGYPPQMPGQTGQSGPYSTDAHHQAQQQGGIQRQVQQQAGVAPTGPGGGTLFTEPVLVVNQKAKLIEVSNEYAVYDQNGTALGSVVEVGQSTAKKVLRVVSSLDQYMTHKLEIRDAYGQPQLVLTRPAKLIKSKVLVARPDGRPVGEIVQQNAIGKINFSMLADGRQVGAIKAENWRAWNFAIVDHTDVEIARITKTWEGLAKTMFTTADNYVLQIHRQLPDPLLSLVVATALTVDTALKQDARGLG